MDSGFLTGLPTFDRFDALVIAIFFALRLALGKSKKPLPKHDNLNTAMVKFTENHAECTQVDFRAQGKDMTIMAQDPKSRSESGMGARCCSKVTKIDSSESTDWRLQATKQHYTFIDSNSKRVSWDYCIRDDKHPGERGFWWCLHHFKESPI